MEQYEKIVSMLSEYGQCTIKEENGELLIRLIPYSNAAVQTNQDEAELSTAGKYAYFTKVSKKDIAKVKEWLKERKGTTNRQKDFLRTLQEAVQKIDYDYWIATIEPSVKDDKIYYAEGEEVGVKISTKQCKNMAKEYAPERGSRLANLHELFIWYALRIVNGFWTLDYVTDNSSSAGNYWNSPDATKKIEKSGKVQCGGYNDGIGNTCKIVTIEDGYARVGGSYSNVGNDYPVTDVFKYYYLVSPTGNSSGVLVLTK